MVSQGSTSTVMVEDDLKHIPGRLLEQLCNFPKPRIKAFRILMLAEQGPSEYRNPRAVLKPRIKAFRILMLAEQGMKPIRRNEL